MAKNILRGVSFLALVIVTLSALSNLLRDRETTLSCMYSEPDDSLDVLIVGSSHVNSGYIPNLLWQENGASACNVFSWSQPMWISYHYIKEALKTQSPSVIVLEMFGMTYGHSTIMPEEIDRTNYLNSFTIDPGLNFLEMTRTVEFCGLDLRSYEDFLNLPRFHTRWKMLNAEMFTYDPHDERDPLKGYGLSMTSAAQPVPSFSEQPAFEPYEYCVEYLEKITALCEKNDIQLIFTVTPYVYNETEQGIFRWIDEYAQAHGIPFLNYNGEDGRRIGIDYETDLSDWGHVNFFGAQKLTMDLCAFLRDTAEFPARGEHKNAEQLDEDLLYYERVLEVQPLLVEKDPAEWLRMAAADPDLTVFLLDTGSSAEATRLVAGVLPARRDGQALIVEQGSATACEARLAFPLFGRAGEVFFDADTGEIFLNDTAAPLSGGAITAVVYDNFFDRPLECVALDENLAFTHREFTSDILPQYK